MLQTRDMLCLYTAKKTTMFCAPTQRHIMFLCFIKQTYSGLLLLKPRHVSMFLTRHNMFLVLLSKTYHVFRLPNKGISCSYVIKQKTYLIYATKQTYHVFISLEKDISCFVLLNTKTYHVSGSQTTYIMFLCY